MTVLGRVVGRTLPGVLRPLAVGVTRPFTGVTRPLERDGVFRPVDMDVVDETEADVGTRPYDGVSRPLRTEATDEGREMLPTPTVGAESLSAPMKTPHFGGHVK